MQGCISFSFAMHAISLRIERKSIKKKEEGGKLGKKKGRKEEERKRERIF